MKLLKILLNIGLFIVFVNVYGQNPKPDAYQFGEGIKFTTNDGHEFKISSYLQPYFETKAYTEANLPEANRFRMRRARLRLDGESANKRFSYRFQFDLTGNSEFEEQEGLYLLDAVINYELTNQITIAFGQRASYSENRELFMNSNSLQLVERSRLSSAFATIREFGLFINGNFKTGGSTILRPYFTLTNGDGGNVLNRDYGGLKVGGRLDFLPFGTFSNFGQFRQTDVMRELTPKLVFGAIYSYNFGISDRRGRTSGDILYLNANNEESLPDFAKFGVDFLFKYKGFSAIGEFVKTRAFVPNDITQRIRENGTIATTFPVDGVENVENYVRGRMMLGEAYNFQMGYLFKSGYSIDTQYTRLNSDQHSFMNNSTFYNRPDYYTIGLSKYLARNYGAKIQTSFTYIKGNVINNNLGQPIEGNEWIGRIMLTFSL
jgi:hypothetical protein